MESINILKSTTVDIIVIEIPLAYYLRESQSNFYYILKLQQ